MDLGLYDRDFYLWAIKNAELIRQGRLSEVDLENIAEELESMGRSEKRVFVDRLAVLFAHLLKWQFQPVLRSKSWRLTIREQRRKVRDLIEDSPSLKHEIRQKINKAYEDAILFAAKDTGIDESFFPQTCPYSFDQAMNDDFRPE